MAWSGGHWTGSDRSVSSLLSSGVQGLVERPTADGLAVGGDFEGENISLKDAAYRVRHFKASVLLCHGWENNYLRSFRATLPLVTHWLRMIAANRMMIPTWRSRKARVLNYIYYTSLVVRACPWAVSMNQLSGSANLVTWRFIYFPKRNVTTWYWPRYKTTYWIGKGDNWGLFD